MQAWVDQHAPPPSRRRLGGGVADEEDDVDGRLADRVGPDATTWTEGAQGGGVPLDEVEGRVDEILHDSGEHMSTTEPLGHDRWTDGMQAYQKG